MILKLLYEFNKHFFLDIKTNYIYELYDTSCAIGLYLYNDDGTEDIDWNFKLQHNLHWSS